MRLILTALTLILTQITFAQYGYYGKYDWAKVPEKYTVNFKDTTEDEEVVFEKRSVEFFPVNGEMFQFNLNHTILVIKTDAGIEMNNKVYISNGPGDEVLKQKARVIKTDGSIVELKQSDIKEQLDENGEVEYRYFALDGLEIGCVVEYLDYIKGSPDYTGSVLKYQSSADKQKVELDLISPKHLDFLVYPVNNMPEMILDSLDTSVRRKFLVTENLKGLKNEYQSPYNSLLQKAYYKLNKNFDSGNGNFYNYNAAAKVVYENMFTVQSKGSVKKMKALVKDMETNGGSTLESKVRYLENKLKSEYSMVESYMPDLSKLDFVFSKKVTNEQGMCILFLQTLREAGIKFELVLTSDREVGPLLTEFEGYNFLSEYLVYVNDLDKYFSPTLFSRLGFPPYETTANKGLFIVEKKLDGMGVAISKIKDIKLVAPELSEDNIYAHVDFTTDLMEPKVEIEHQVSGYKAIYFQPILDLLEDERKKKVMDEILVYIDKDSKLENVAYKNDKSADAGVNPFSAKATFVGMPLTESAGDKILFKVGLLLGPQAASYNKEERKLPVETEYAKIYHRELKITLPDNLTAKNLDILNMNVVTEDGSTGFKSSYTMNGNELVVTIVEFYNKIYYPVSEYKGYENVINAAADFNKFVLVLEKK